MGTITRMVVLEFEFGSGTNQQLARMALQELGVDSVERPFGRLELTREDMRSYGDAIERIVHEYGGAEVYW